ncbi:MAG: GtrA family protein [Oscillospiraceae bacterium]|nr:GtrA family protein [Oscillospiraceae bacterium]
MLEALLQFALKLCPKPLKKIWDKYENIWRYCYYGLWTTVISYVTKIIGQWLFGLAGYTMKQTVPNILNTTVSWIIAATFAFLVNKKYVFMSKTTERSELMHEIYTFYGARLVSFGMEVMLMWLTTVLLEWNYYLMAFLVQFLIVALNYVFSKLVVFKKGAENAQNAGEQSAEIAKSESV